jgi:hypothetical protein
VSTERRVDWGLLDCTHTSYILGAQPATTTRVGGSWSTGTERASDSRTAAPGGILLGLGRPAARSMVTADEPSRVRAHTRRQHRARARRAQWARARVRACVRASMCVCARACMCARARMRVRTSARGTRVITLRVSLRACIASARPRACVLACLRARLCRVLSSSRGFVRAFGRRCCGSNR